MNGQGSVIIDQIQMTYGKGDKSVRALDPISLNIKNGEFVAIVGPSGCGKSTLLKIVAGLLAPTAGTVTVNDELVRKPITDVGIVFQQHLLLPWRNSLQNILLQIEARKLSDKDYRQHALDLIEQTGLTGFEDKYPGELSGGMAQRVSICRALVHDPPLLLMDEPFGALDALTRDQMNQDLERICREAGKTVLFITHSIAEAVFLADRVVVMSPRPGNIDEIIDTKISKPKNFSHRETPQFIDAVQHIRGRFEQMGVLRGSVPTNTKKEIR